ncbi:hypothetical protein O53_185 [Microcystis aeruginosa TAIHU98]|uniref:Uncharacterized protein n=1 Tax=Microcystis aeruginosa TAIHU98 TaxID=1134457 RepID=L7EAC3_MICAE|nr:hypothetical protein O53_185 [Microcystis aeruginosa TAIHU98]
MHEKGFSAVLQDTIPKQVTIVMTNHRARTIRSPRELLLPSLLY